MVDIAALHIHYRDFDGKKNMKKIKPTDAENKLAIQHDILEAVRKLRDAGKYEYYYVVVEINKAEGGKAYRTIVPKTLF